MKYGGVLLFFLLQLPAQGQGVVKSFFSLGRPEQCWALSHPFKAGKAFRITRDVRKHVSEVYRYEALDSFPHGGSLDAYRHCYWMASLGGKIGSRAARKLGKAHEKSNYRAFRRGKAVDGVIQDSNAVVMDLHNNEAGLRLAEAHPEHSPESLQQLVMEELRSGRLLRLKTNHAGQLLPCEGSTPVDFSRRGRKQWQMPTCLLKSNE
ncbi:MAG: hypothetical protein JNL88_13245 [Bacteroidia bacterium]|nr:hypothetical protein [Bacteroidia bacterium]